MNRTFRWASCLAATALLAPLALAAEPASDTAALEARIRALEEKLATQEDAQKAGAKEEQASSADGISIPADEPDVDYAALDSGGMVPGKGAKIYKGKDGEVWISAYAVFRALNQQPSDQTAYDHLGAPIAVDPRLDFNLHRVMIHFKGWLYDERFRYSITNWTVNDTEQVRIVGHLNYVFDKTFILSAGVNGLPGTRTLNNSHPYWLGHDRVMADEFFRPGFTSGIWAAGELPGTLNYRVMVGNNLSQLGVPTKKMTRDLATSATFFIQPTTGEFGPLGGFGDFEYHEELATRFGISMTNHREDRASQPDESMPDATQIVLADSRYLFEANALAPGLTIQKALYRMAAMDAGMKYKGIFIGTEVYRRELSEFLPTDLSAVPVPVKDIVDTGYYVQTAFFPIPKKWEIYLSTSQIWGDEDAGYGDSNEYILGTNWYWSGNRNQRVNFQVIDVNKAPVRSLFGYYGAGLNGQIYSAEVSMMF